MTHRILTSRQHRNIKAIVLNHQKNILSVGFSLVNLMLVLGTEIPSSPVSFFQGTWYFESTLLVNPIF